MKTDFAWAGNELPGTKRKENTRASSTSKYNVYQEHVQTHRGQIEILKTCLKKYTTEIME